MEDEINIQLAGQWFGFFSYGPEYGAFLVNEKVTFSILIEEVFNHQFKGKCIELEGIGASTELSNIEGFLENEFISFTKEYPTNNFIDEKGNAVYFEDTSNLRLSYKGKFNRFNQTFNGTWEIWSNEVPSGDGVFVNISTGTWELSKDPARYGI